MRDVPFTRSLFGRLWRRETTMRADWDRRARENAPYYVCTTAAESPESFAASGERDLEEKIIDGLHVSPRWRVLEIGCGMGRLLRPLSRRVERVVGVDLSEEMLRRAREHCASLPNVDLKRTDGRLDFLADGTFDFVFSHIVFQHLPRKAYAERYFREAFRVLAPGGIFRVQVDGRSHQVFRRWIADSWSGVVFSARELSRRLERAGFRVTEIRGEGTQYLRATAVKPERTADDG
ncbi:MAG: methyltransferase domain-containing protein [Acidobacteriota bacterium]|nr:methyltransferase domain-containing protein [Acidobacteriota bacterium]